MSHTRRRVARFARRAMAVAAAGVVAALATAPPASAHSTDGAGPTNFVTDVRGVVPAVSQISVRPIEFGARLELENRSGTTVLVRGYDGEPYLRLDSRGVFRNRRSPATYVNADRQGSTAIPADADPDAPPEWVKLTGGNVVRWHDHRAHWMGTTAPPVVARDPTRAHVIYSNWTVGIDVDGQPAEITGTLRWDPGPSRTPWLAAAAVLGLLVVAVARRWWRVTLAVAVAGLTAVDVFHVVGLVLAPEKAGSAVSRFAGVAFLPVWGWIAGLVALRLLVRGRIDGAYAAAVCALAVFALGGVGDIAALARSQVAFRWSDALARAVITISIGAGAGTLVAACMTIRRVVGPVTRPRAG